MHSPHKKDTGVANHSDVSCIICFHMHELRSIRRTFHFCGQLEAGSDNVIYLIKHTDIGTTYVYRTFDKAGERISFSSKYVRTEFSKRSYNLVLWLISHCVLYVNSWVSIWRYVSQEPKVNSYREFTRKLSCSQGTECTCVT